MKRQYLFPALFYEDAKRRYDELLTLSKEINKRLSKYPEGKIHVTNKKGNIQYYLRMNPKDKIGDYIAKKEDKKISLYLQKKYDEEVIRLIQREINVLETFLNSNNSIPLLIQEKYSQKPREIKEKIIPIDMADMDYAMEWKNAPYEGKKIGEDVPKFVTNNGECVRSKSELTIANALNKWGVFYKYECPLRLSNGRMIYPDFIILNVKRRKEIIWEHRGMMDNEEYARKSVYRIKQLESDGFLLGDRLIITEETSDNPLGTDEIDRMIKKYVLE